MQQFLKVLMIKLGSSEVQASRINWQIVCRVGFLRSPNGVKVFGPSNIQLFHLCPVWFSHWHLVVAVYWSCHQVWCWVWCHGFSLFFFLVSDLWHLKAFKTRSDFLSDPGRRLHTVFIQSIVKLVIHPAISLYTYHYSSWKVIFRHCLSFEDNIRC